jgi:hypothetical protein
VSTFPKTRAAAGYAARHGRTEFTRTRAAVLLKRLNTYEAAMAGASGQLPATVAGLLRSLVLATRNLAGPAWLEANGDDPDVAAFTALQATLYPPEAAEIDEICARVLWARYAPHGAARDGTAGNGARPGRPAHGPLPGGEEGDSSHAHRTGR